MYQRILLGSEVKGYDLNKFFKEKGIVKAFGVDFTTDDFFKLLEDCDLNVRIINAMKTQDIRCIGELLQYPADEFKLLRNFGATSVKEIREYVFDHYPSINLGGLNHVMSLFWSFRDEYTLPVDPVAKPNLSINEPKPAKISEININGFNMAIHSLSSVLIAERPSGEDDNGEMVILHRIYQNGKSEKTPINVKLLLGMTAKSFIYQFNHLCYAKYLDQLRNPKKTK
jgi:hypothetical protein